MDLVSLDAAVVVVGKSLVTEVQAAALTGMVHTIHTQNVILRITAP